MCSGQFLALQTCITSYYICSTKRLSNRKQQENVFSESCHSQKVKNNQKARYYSLLVHLQSAVTRSRVLGRFQLYNHVSYPMTYVLKDYQTGNDKTRVLRNARILVGTLFDLKLDIAYIWSSFKMLQVHVFWVVSSFTNMYPIQ